MLQHAYLKYIVGYENLQQVSPGRRGWLAVPGWISLFECLCAINSETCVSIVEVHLPCCCLVVPTALRHRLFQLTHTGPTVAHLGSLRTTLQLRQLYYWRGLKRDVADGCRECDECAKGKGPLLRSHGHLQKIHVGAPLDLVTMDILSGLLTATDGSKYVQIMVDAFTKWV